MKNTHRTLLPIAIVVSAVLMGACGAKDPQELIGSAKAYLAKNDSKAAIIELKTLLQDSPESGEARYLLGKAMLASGDVVSAELELRKALAAGHPLDETAPELARAMFVLAQYQKLTEQFGQTVLSDPVAEADLKVTLARTYGGLGRRDLAREAALAALKAMPGHGPATLFMIRLQADTGDIDGALAAIDAEIAKRPQDFEAWQVKGDLLLQGKRDTDGALAAYQQSLAAKPNHFIAHSGALTILLGKQDLEGAKAQLANMQAVLPKHPQTLYFAGNVALMAKDIGKAREIAQQLLRVAADNPRVLQLAGAVEYEGGSLVQAESLLSKALQLAPDMAIARRLLALTYLRSSQPARALSTLQPFLEAPNPSADTFALVAQAQLQSGDLDEAEKSFAQAAKLNPEDTHSKTAIAVSQLLKGNTGGGLETLRSLAKDDAGVTADLPLIGALVRQRDFAGAQKAIDALEKKQPDQPVAANLRGRVLLMQGDRPGAVKAFEQAIKIQPSFYPAAAALAQLALADKDFELAKKHLDAVLKADPKSSQALLANAGLKARMGAPREEIIGIFNGAIQQAPQDPAPRLALVNYQLANKDVKAAVEAAQLAATAMPDNPAMVDALGRALAAAGDTHRAVATFNKLVQLTPDSPAPYMRLADVQWAAQNREAAVQSLKRALNIAPENLAAQRALIDAHVADKNTKEAVAVARTIQKQRPTRDIGYLLEGATLASQKSWDDALRVYRDGLKATGGSTELATRIHVALLATGRTAEADQHVKSWLKAHPDDVGFSFYLGDVAMSKQDLPEAEARYREVLKLQPENGLALNNVAWLLAVAKKPGAVAMAEKAVEVLPNRPVIMDTLAFALGAEGQPAKGVDVMKKALEIEGKNPALRLNLAKLLAQAGDKAAAKSELEALAALGTAFPRQAEVAALLKSL